MVRETAAEIFKELNKEEKAFWFDLKEKKFLHQVDTFYYSVKLKNDFTSDSFDPSCIAFRQFINDNLEKSEKFVWGESLPFYVEDFKESLNFLPKRFGRFYDACLSSPDMFDIFVARKVPLSADGEASVTPEIIVQLRSVMLWQYGISEAFRESFKTVEAVCKHFDLQIESVKENRTDFCWHTNYLQNPAKFFAPQKFNNRLVTRLGTGPRSNGTDVNYRFTFQKDGETEINYIAIGNRGEKCFVRIYNKTKEVIQMGYKGWFLKEWLFNGMISRYDFDIYEKCYQSGSWKDKTKFRLEWYLEHGKKEFFKKDIRAILDGIITPAPETLEKLANTLTPKLTVIMNVEYQVMRKMTKSIPMLQVKDNSDKGVCKQIYDFIDNRPLIVKYLTKDTLRLVERTEENKSRCEDCAFWSALRNTKFVDMKKLPDELKVIRDYSRRINSAVVRKRVISSVITYSLYMNGIDNNQNGYEDAADIFCTLNDNDIINMRRIKEKRKKQLNKELFSGAMPKRQHTVSIYDNQTGEILGGDQYDFTDLIEE